METLKRRYGSIFGPLAVMAIILVLYLFAGHIMYGRINSIRSTIASAEAEKQSLSTRLATLREAEGIVLSSTSTKLVEALPERNPSLYVVGQLRDEASKQQVVLDNLNLSTQPATEGNPLAYVAVEFDIRGSYEQVSGFVENISKAMPVMKMDSLRLTETSGELEAKISLQSFWSPFPETLPTIDQAIQGLTETEIQTLNELTDFKGLTINEVKPSEATEEARPDPFSLEI